MLLILLFACTGPSPSDDKDPDDTGVPSGFAFADVAVAPTDDMPTVLRATWATDPGSAGWVEVAPADGSAPAWRVEAVGDVEHEALIIGLAPDTDYVVTAGATAPDDGTYTADPLTVRTGEAPRDLPDLNATVVEDAAADGLFAVGMVSQSSLGALIDRTGNYSWWYRIPDPGNYVTRVTRSVDGRTVLVNSAPAAGESETSRHRMYRVSYAGVLEETLDLPLHHHDYCELPDGTIAFLAFDYREVDGERINGDALVERAPDGTLRTVWSAWDWYDFADYADAAAGTEFVHANVVRHDPADDTYVVGLRNVGGLVRIDRASGAIVDHLGGDGSSYTLTEGTPMEGQHSFTLLDDGFVVLDNRDDVSEPSRAVEYRLEGAEMREVWSYQSPGRYHEIGLGDAVRLPNGNTRVVWSSSGELNEVTPEGVVVWKVNLDVGTGFGYGAWSEDLQAWP